jgi:hypothetical protein
MEEIKVTISKKNLSDRLKEEIKGKNSGYVVDAMLSLINTDQEALGKIFMASLGILPGPGKYSVGDVVLIPADSLSNWKFDLDKMTDEGLIIKDMVECNVLEYNVYNERYLCEYEFINSQGERGTDTNLASEYTIKGLAEELPNF